jgi:tetratricopeptide (TPR) repeat protein
VVWLLGGRALGVVLSAICLCLPVTIFGQDSATKTPDPPQPAADVSQTGEPQNAAIRVTVLADDKKPLGRQAVVKLVNKAHENANWQTTSDKSETIFGDLSFGKYEVEVSAVGFITSRQDVDVVNLVDTVPVQIVLQRDPSAAEQNVTSASMSLKANQDMIRAIKALNIDDFKEAQKRLSEADKLAPSSAQLKFLEGYWFFEQGAQEKAEQYLNDAVALNPRYAHALTLLGRVQFAQGHTQQAQATLEQAVNAEPNYWVSHSLLADVYLQQHEYQKAREQAQLAITKGRRHGVAAQLALGEAQANLGDVPQAAQALKIFLASEPKSPATPHAQELLALLEQRQATAASGSDGKFTQAASFAAATDMLPPAHASLPEMTWQPPGIDEEVPPVAAGVNCPFEKVIEGAGAGAQQLVADVAKFAAIEDLVHERLDEMGNPTARETRKFDYAASLYQSQPDVVLVDEYRTERYGSEDLPDRIADNGFAALALVFHPIMRDEFQMTCEGLGDWHGQPTWLVRFQQRDDRPNRMQAYVLGGIRHSVGLKGRAWITADKFQIVRIETEMARPMPEIDLLVEHQITEYGPVPFKRKDLELWLPKTAEVYMQFRGRRYYRKHTFEKYMLFSVEEQQKVHEAKHDPARPESRNPAQGKSSTS